MDDCEKVNCPHCAGENEITDLHEFYSGEVFEHECSACGKPFDVMIERYATLTVWAQDGEESEIEAHMEEARRRQIPDELLIDPPCQTC